MAKIRNIILMLIVIILNAVNLHSTISTGFNFRLFNLKNFKYRNIQNDTIYISAFPNKFYSPDKKYYCNSIYDQYPYIKLNIYNKKGFKINHIDSLREVGNIDYFWIKNICLILDPNTKILHKIYLNKTKLKEKVTYSGVFYYLGKDAHSIYYKTVDSNGIIDIFQMSENKLKKLKTNEIIDSNLVSTDIIKYLTFYDGNLKLFKSNDTTDISFHQFTKFKYKSYIGIIGNKYFGGNQLIESFDMENDLICSNNKYVLREKKGILKVYNKNCKILYELNKTNKAFNLIPYPFNNLINLIHEIEFINENIILIIYYNYRVTDDPLFHSENSEQDSRTGFLYYDLKANKALKKYVILSKKSSY